MYKDDLALNILQRLIWHKINENQTKSTKPIAILFYKQMNLNLYWNEISYKLLTHKSWIYIHFKEFKQDLFSIIIVT